MSNPVLTREAVPDVKEVAISVDTRSPFGISSEVVQQYAHASVKPPIVTFVEFIRLAQQWRQDTAQTSSLEQKFEHPAYREIISMGEDVVPFILRDMRLRPDYWFEALTAITGDDPIEPASYGRLDEMVASWLRWAEQHHMRF